MRKIIVPLMIISFSAHSLYANTKWPSPEWTVDRDQAEKMGAPLCEEFAHFSTQSKNFKTEGLVVIKDGELKYEYYDSAYNAQKPHALWSVSKTITGALLGTAVNEGKIDLEQGLFEFYPRPIYGDLYERIKIKNLFYLDTGFIWDEYYFGDVKKSPVITMLYGKGHKDMAKYAAASDIIQEGPGYEFNYTTGTPTITMGVLKNIYGKNYDQMPWKNFFDPIGLKNVIFEKDATGTFNGGASVFATPRDMAKIGYLYLNHGLWNGTQVLSKEWIKKTLTVSPGYLSSGTVINDITDDGVFGGSIWLNVPAKAGFGRPYPVSPQDMFLAMGHYGQLIIVLPTQKMVIARTGYDMEYNPYVDEFVTRAISCFADPNYQVGKYIPPPKREKELKTALLTLKTGIKNNIFQPTVAKTICSCHFNSGLDVDTCLKRSNIPEADKLTSVYVSENGVSVKASWLGSKLGLKRDYTSRAVWDKTHPEFGCTLQ
ncbi:MAG: serine hydrolase domain-containing protein [Bacteriovorax sp.]